MADLEGPLNVDFEQDIASLGEVAEDGGFGGAVIFAINFGIFEEFIAVEAFEEFVFGDEFVAFSHLVARPLVAGGGGDGVSDMEELGEAARDGGFADAGGAAEDDEMALFLRHIVHNLNYRRPHPGPLPEGEGRRGMVGRAHPTQNAPSP